MSKFYLLTVEICDSVPLIWRRVYVPSEITLDRLSDVIQIIFGWSEDHLYNFDINDNIYSKASENKHIKYHVETHRLSSLITESGESFKYVYNFEDVWEHIITVEDTGYVPLNPNDTILCLGGDRACPVEDTRGIRKYLEFCDAIMDPEHHMRTEYVSWYCSKIGDKDHNPSYFNPNVINKELKKFVHWSSDRLLDWEEIRI